MVGTFTQKRVAPVESYPLGYEYKQDALALQTGRFDGSTAGLQVPKQVTTSFRSGGSWEARTDIPSYASLIAESEERGYNQFDTGHAFETTRDEYRISHPNFFLRNASGTRWYRGPLLPDSRLQSVRDEDYPVIQAPSDLDAWGRRAIRSTIPTNPVAGLSVFLGELRQGLPSLIGLNLMRNRAGTFRELGGEYLNVQFGWKPFLKDIQKTMVAVQNSNIILAQYQRDSGRFVRRRFTFPDEYTVDFQSSGPKSSAIRNVPNGTGWGSLWTSQNATNWLETVETTKSTWFAGAYTYYLEESQDLTGRFTHFEQLSNKLLGTRVTPEVLWELAPWSWLADWIADIGVSLENASAFSADKLVMRYGYLMRRTRRRRIVSLSGIDPLIGDCGAIVTEFTKTRKQRIKATPYGFGLNASSFTGSQWAILAALGMTKGPKSLR